MEASTRVEVELRESDRKTILLGMMIGSADLGGIGRIEIIGSGDTIEFRVRMDDGAHSDWRLDLQPLAQRAIELARECAEEEAAVPYEYEERNLGAESAD